MDDVKTIPKQLEAFILFSCDGTSVQNVPVIMHSIYVMLKVVRIVGMDSKHRSKVKCSVGTNVRNIPMYVFDTYFGVQGIRSRWFEKLE